MIGRLRKFAAAAVLCAACCGGAVAADPPFASTGELDSYLESNSRALERALGTYNKRHRILVPSSGEYWNVKVTSSRIDRLQEDRAFVTLAFEIREYGGTYGRALFELRWDGERIEIAGHRETPQTEVEPAAASSGVDDSPPARPYDDVATYIEQDMRDLERALEDYNKRHRIVVPSSGEVWQVKITSSKIDRLQGDRAFVAMAFELDGYWREQGGALFELRWVDDELQFVGHGPLPRKRGAASGWLARGDDGCIYNYYAPQPCVDVVRGWTEFAETHGLALDPESAAIFQSYKHSDFATGDRLMARARGLPDPEGGSAFGLQAEVRALNLSRYQGIAEAGCDLNPLGPRPCLEILPIYQGFIRRHGLADDPSSATMFEAYAQGNYKKADVIYALAKGLDVPAYGYLSTGAAREVAALRMRIDQIESKYSQPCSYNPYMPEGDAYRACPEIITLWREFAERYQLADDAENGRIFEQYARGEYQAGDQLLAQAKGVSLEQLLEASGVPTGGLVIEVYPGTPQRMGLGRMGS